MTKFLIFLLLIFVSLALKANDKIQITSDNLTLNKKDLSATFEGNVRVFFEDQSVSTNKLIIYYSDLGPKREIVKIIFPTKIKAIKNQPLVENIEIFDIQYFFLFLTDSKRRKSRYIHGK